MRPILLATCLSLLALGALAEPDPTPLEFTQLDLLDGRKLRNVVIKSYDQTTRRVLLISDKKAQTVPLALIPPPFSEMLRRGAPTSGGSVTTVPTTALPAGPIAPAITSRPDTPASTPVADPELATHRAAALDRATTFYRYEFVAGSAAIRVQSVRLDAIHSQTVPGWPGRYRTSGKAYLELFDTKGWSATRAESTFEVITEQKPGEPLSVIDFSRKT